ncbi:MAG: hypothetical protein ABFC77_11685 [Thermoguttaceae bacterium]
MRDQPNNNDDWLDRLIREAGDPTVSLDAQYVERLKTAILRRAASVPNSPRKVSLMKRIVRVAVAASIVFAVGAVVAWLTFGGSSANIAFADVAKALDSLRSATFDVVSEVREKKDSQPITAAGKGYFLAPCHQRIETSVNLGREAAVKGAEAAAKRIHKNDGPASANRAAQAAAKSMAKAVGSMPEMIVRQIMIADSQAEKCILLYPNMKTGMLVDSKKMRELRNKPAQPDLFEMVRRLVREGNSGTGEKTVAIGKKEIDGRKAVGFRVCVDLMDMTFWADPKTAYPVRIEVGMGSLGNVRVVMNNFQYNVALDPSLFSLTPPAGYSMQTMDVTAPVEKDLLKTLRIIAEHSKNVFPAKLEMNQEVMKALMVGLEPKMDKATEQKLEAVRKEIEAKYGGREKLRAKYGKNIPPEIMAEVMKATMPIMQEQMKKRMPTMQNEMLKRSRGLLFYQTLKPDNDAHYLGGGVQLDTPDRPIFWYKPTGSQKYHVIYADLSVKEVAPSDLPKMPQPKDGLKSAKTNDKKSP